MLSEKEGLVALNEDQKAVALRDCAKACSLYSDLHRRIKGGSFDIEIRRVILSLAENLVVKIGETLGYETDLKQEMEQRFAEIRERNAEIHELKKQLGRAGDIETLPKKLALLSEKLRAWWRKQGFGHISDIRFTEHGLCHVDLSCHLFGDFALTGSDTPVTDDERRGNWLEELQALGFEIAREGSYDANIVDSDASRKLIHAMVQERFPSAWVTEFAQHFNVQHQKFYLRSAKVIIRNLAEIDVLQERE